LIEFYAILAISCGYKSGFGGFAAKERKDRKAEVHLLARIHFLIFAFFAISCG